MFINNIMLINNIIIQYVYINNINISIMIM